MNYDIVFAGVGGQGGLSISAIIGSAALEDGLHLKQSESHGMSQRGGAVQATLRLADRPVQSALVPRAAASLILSMEPLESLRYLELLSPEGMLLTARTPLKNIPDYPQLEALFERIRALPHAQLVDADALARKAGSTRAANVVMLGAAARHLPVSAAALERAIERSFARKGPDLVKLNLEAFRLGRTAVA